MLFFHISHTAGNLQLGGCKYKIYIMTTVNFVIYTHQLNSKFTTRHFTCISIVVDILLFVYLFMALDGIEKLFNITDRSYNVQNQIDFTYNTCSISSAVSTTCHDCIFSEFVKEKNRTCIFQQAGETKNSVVLHLLQRGFTVIGCGFKTLQVGPNFYQYDQ